MSEKQPETVQEVVEEEESPGLFKFVALFFGVPFILIIVFTLLTH